VLKSLSSNYSSSNWFFQTALLARNGRNHLTAKPRAAIALGFFAKTTWRKISVMAHEICRFLSSKWCFPQMEDPQ
jgi:hypothetical protein